MKNNFRIKDSNPQFNSVYVWLILFFANLFQFKKLFNEIYPISPLNQSIDNNTPQKSEENLINSSSSWPRGVFNSLVCNINVIFLLSLSHNKLCLAGSLHSSEEIFEQSR